MNCSIKQIDEVIHRERIDKEKKKVVHQRISAQVPEGTFILFDAEPYIVSKERLHRWTPFGYEKSITLPQDSLITVLTPNSIVNAFHAGYIPEIAGAN